MHKRSGRRTRWDKPNSLLLLFQCVRRGGPPHLLALAAHLEVRVALRAAEKKLAPVVLHEELPAPEGQRVPAERALVGHSAHRFWSRPTLSMAVSLRMITSPLWIGPTTLRVTSLSLSSPSMTSAFTRLTPFAPILPITWITSAATRIRDH